MNGQLCSTPVRGDSSVDQLVFCQPAGVDCDPLCRSEWMLAKVCQHGVHFYPVCVFRVDAETIAYRASNES